MKKSIITMAGLFLLAALLGSCASQSETAAEEPVVAEAALTVTGPAVNLAWSEADLKALPATETEYTNKDGETTTYTGVAFADLLAAAGIDSYASLVLVAADGYSGEVTVEELDACPKCIVAFDGDSLRSVMPDMSGKQQVKDLVEIQVK